jgi:hypothetical protein
MDAPIKTDKLTPSCHPDALYYANELCKRCFHKEYMQTRRVADRPRHNNAQREQRRKIKLEFILEYGGICSCCGEPNVGFLTLEHKNGDGKEHRKKFHTTTQQLADLRRRGWPKDDYELLCYNCNLGRAKNGGICPHISEEKF